MSDYKIGQTGKDDSGMGGTFPVKIIAIDEKGIKVQVTQRGWNKLTYCVSEDRARSIFNKE